MQAASIGHVKAHRLLPRQGPLDRFLIAWRWHAVAHRLHQFTQRGSRSCPPRRMSSTKPQPPGV